jgi:hypothetical protein
METLKRLREQQVAHSIIVSDVFMKMVDGEVGKEYFLMIPKAHNKDIKGMGFFNVEDDDRILGKQMTGEEIKELVFSKDNYIKTLQMKEGRILEWKLAGLKQAIS